MPVLSRRAATILLLAGLGLGGCASPGSVTQTTPVAPLNLEADLALKGHDAVAYFTEGAPVPGRADIAFRWRDATWRFASVAHRDAFAAEPERYAPRYGGYCAFALSRGFIADVDPAAWAIDRGGLYLNNNAFAHQLWLADRADNIAAGDRNWPLIPKLRTPG